MYTTATLRATAQAALAVQQRAREETRRRAEAEARRGRAALQARQLSDRLAVLGSRLDALADDAARTGTGAAVRGLHDRQTGLTRWVSPAGDDEAALTALSREYGRLDAEAGRLAASVADKLARQAWKEALDSMRDTLSAAPQRTVFDPAGARELIELTSQALAAAAGGGDFPTAFATLTGRAGVHLETVAVNRTAADEAHALADGALAALHRVLGEARAEGIALAWADAALAVAQRIAAVRDAAWPGPERLRDLRRDAAALAETSLALAGELEERLARMDRAARVVEAAVAALPGAGFQLVAGSTVRYGDHIVFRSMRMDDSSILDIDVTPDAVGTVTIAYHGKGTDFTTDFTTETSCDPEIRRCDVTEAMLDLLHAGMEKDDVATNDTHWDGTPDK